MLEKQIVNDVTGGPEILLLENRSQILRQGERRLLAEGFLDLLCRILVASIDHGQLETTAKSGARVGGGDELGQFNDVRERAAVGAAG